MSVRGGAGSSALYLSANERLMWCVCLQAPKKRVAAAPSAVRKVMPPYVVTTFTCCSGCQHQSIALTPSELILAVAAQQAAPAKPVNPLFEKRPKTFGAPPLPHTSMWLSVKFKSARFVATDGCCSPGGGLFAAILV